MLNPMAVFASASKKLVTGKQIVEIWYVKSGGGLATDPKNMLIFQAHHVLGD